MAAALKSTRRAIAVLCAALLSSTTTAKADVVLDWNGIMMAMVKDQPPPYQNRFAAITQLAVFDAVNAVAGGYQPYLGGMTPTPDASAEAAAVSAAHRVLVSYFADHTEFLDAERAKSLSSIPDGATKQSGIAIGEAVAAEIMAARVNDGAALSNSYLPDHSKPGDWQLTADCPPTGGVFLHWRNVTPFVMRSADQFRLEAPPALTSNAYTRSFQEVKDVGGRDSTKRSQDRTRVAKAYAELGAAALWNPIARQMASAKHLSLSENARAFALLNMALSDGAVAIMDTKYHYNFWRPETAIIAAGADGNDGTDADSSFVPLIPAPCFPSYPSGHATTSYAAREVLERIFGDQGHSITVSSPALPDVVLNYTRLEDITTNIDDARVYGGIHFRFDQEGGATQGREVGAYVFTNSLRPAKGNGRKPSGQRR